MAKVKLEISTQNANKPALLVEIEADADYKELLSHALGSFDAVKKSYMEVQNFIQNIENAESASDDASSIPEEKRIDHKHELILIENSMYR